ncbi:NADP-dependent oxidoreductase [Lacticaseibacillus saniviri]|uniref:Nadph quinone reductase n=1 Tax=Lacticaseibacillus saniviri JCM 17471 = DSM 24301 TaxID=1293598 RepID=A0A0R2MPF8_9LACO|nr:NADP-dependent oxidoreductase [Lacticaseibacillus saniviri]KRO15541.1 nadph quinone reductase [Lacticaseibacillus saniviri JCM 17471 = DSM 24301]MCG4281637.1 NADP-dependent oxidoreductase [Lacticaseibacillus saniviri]
MQAFGYTHAGGPEVIEAVTLPTPEPTAQQVQIRVEAIGLNNRERAERQNAPGPMVTGRDVAGVVTKVGATASSFAVGDRVVAHVEHGYAETAVANLDAVVALPDAISFEDAAAIVTPAITAYKTLNAFTTVNPGQTLIIKGVTGAVGAIAAQLAVAKQATVIGIGAARNADFVDSLGVSQFVAYDQVAIATALADRGDIVMNAAMDGVGTDDDIAMVKPGGTIVSVAHGVPSSNKKFDFINIRPTNTPTDAQALTAIIALMADHKLHMPIDMTLPFTRDGFVAGHQQLDVSHTGRIVISRALKG